MPKIKTHSGAKNVSSFQRMVRLSVLMQTRATSLIRKLLSVKEVSDRLL